MIRGLNLIFKDRRYLLAAIILYIAISLVFSINMGFIYITPTFFINYFEFFDGGAMNILLNLLFVFVAPILASLTIIIAIYKFIEIKKGIAKESASILGFMSSIFVSTCQNCVPILLYSLGVTYGMFTSIFAPFNILFKILAISIFSISFYLSLKSLNKYCKIRR